MLHYQYWTLAETPLAVVKLWIEILQPYPQNGLLHMLQQLEDVVGVGVDQLEALGLGLGGR